ncbi:MAG: magnesium/cobalt transporter CorA [Anaerolineae bacterium]|nr:magnesium/cobalt transporter CorA [Anaerolineae bacterium]
MIRVLFRDSGGEVREDIDIETAWAALETPGTLLWVDLGEEPPEVTSPILLDLFGFHPLAVEDALQEAQHVPRVDDWQDYLYLVLHGLLPDGQGPNGEIPVSPYSLLTLEVDVFLGERYLVTHWVRRIAAMERMWANCRRDRRSLARGTSALLYQLADEIFDDFMPVVEVFDEVLDQVQREVFAHPTSAFLGRVFELKRAQLHVRRLITPQREMLNKLARGDYELVAVDDRVFFRDVYDHLVRLYEIADAQRDATAGIVDTYLSVINNRMNEIVKTLTVVTTLFLPLSFLASFFGMNFFAVPAPTPAWTSPGLLVVAMLMMLLMPIAMYLWMRRKAWM